MGPDLAGDLLVNRHRRVMLNIEHGGIDPTAVWWMPQEACS
jgi:hypothetical protein